jgi:hypothetical protein
MKGERAVQYTFFLQWVGGLVVYGVYWLKNSRRLRLRGNPVVPGYQGQSSVLFNL